MSASKKIVVIGGTGLIGSKTVALLRAGGHHVIAASPNTGVDTLTGEGLAQALEGADVVVDVSNAPSFEPAAVLSFFETSGRNLLAAEAQAQVRHHVVLSIVGTDRMPDNGYFQAKVAQEALVTGSPIPFTIVRSTQFLEFLGGIADAGTTDGKVRLPGGLFQPIAADDVAAILANVALADPRNGVIDIAGPERAPFDEMIRRYLRRAGDPRVVERDPEARYFGGTVNELSLVPLSDARLGRTNLDGWFQRRETVA
ncbi:MULTISPECIES: SDR family oxidoreductase [Azospirillum]|uniref:SDR family oxidoreductase n=1 Tax=Azospirillum brasilense TaxID=192 RepID=A0A4D8QWZ6_AZOBR|nr:MULTISPECIES: SDR family oxidoreductase [Azospirillum]MDW7557629.1 SDR family oxidoreductase [Azospirillum brasilense]MDW7597303.1 SDR family oxidoreductase [Azospirillum brasilense]MDW7632476.1 SDR family oxidoreductase [Azospirillum brasilense]MDX5950232.1 SDR family oxidoreductase [Azospirillum brasilense]NUB12824.1 NAD(P)H-binding protein [Azospirillum brasilense]